MEGLMIWPHSYCRSTLAFYKGLGIAFKCQTVICMLNNTSDKREKVGFSSNEFDDMKIIFIESDAQAIELITLHSGWLHLFGAYQNSPKHQRLILKAQKLNIKYGIISEAPCNMESSIDKKLLKNIYINMVLPVKVNQYIKHSEFVINLSGDSTNEMGRLGWRLNKIIPCGYYSPPIIGSKVRQREEKDWNNFTILMTGIHEWHRSPMLLMEALYQLNKYSLKFQSFITQEGPLLPEMKKYALDHDIRNVDFLGFVPMEKLIQLYETCSVFIGAGSHEPWGMRLNDALQCGAPLIVNEGMGGRKLVDDYKCGFVFEKDNSYDLAMKIKSLILDKNLYLQIASNAASAAIEIDPLRKAKYIADIITKQYKISL